jgi:hypothetical protein
MVTRREATRCRWGVIRGAARLAGAFGDARPRVAEFCWPWMRCDESGWLQKERIDRRFQIKKTEHLRASTPRGSVNHVAEGTLRGLPG